MCICALTCVQSVCTFLVWVDTCVCLLLWAKVFTQTWGEDTGYSKEQGELSVR